MKIIHLSDPHIYTKILEDIDPINRFELALNHIIKNHLDSDLFVITGDLTHFGDEESYYKLHEILTKSDLSNKLYPKLMIGNHDNRENIKKIFSNILIDENGFIQYLIDIEDKRFIFLDTNLPGTDQGYFCKKRQSWLIDNLENNNENKKIYLFMHHNPLPLADESSDQIGLQQREEFKNIIFKHKNLIKHIFFGHQHITASGNYLGINFSSPRSTWCPLVPNFSSKYRLGSANTDPNYNVVLIKNDSLIVHSEDFLKTKINWFTN